MKKQTYVEPTLEQCILNLASRPAGMSGYDLGQLGILRGLNWSLIYPEARKLIESGKLTRGEDKIYRATQKGGK